MHKRIFFYENVSRDLTSFSQKLGHYFLFFFFENIFFMTLIPVILFLETVLAAPILF